MMYIPGFSNYLETSVPEYGPEPIMDAEPAAPRRATVGPMTREALSPVETAMPYDLSGLSGLSGLDLSGLNSLYGMNFGSDFGGGAMGGIFPDNPNLQYIGAPTSNRGNATGKMGGNTFTMTPDQPVRLVDLRTNTVVFEGTGYDAARKATELGQSMTDSLGRKANYDIQTADPSGLYTTVANEKKNKSTLGQIGDVVGTALPIVVSLIPGLQFLGPVASAALAGGAGAALKGENILKGAIIGGATAGLTSGLGIDKAIGGALSNAGKGAAQGAVNAGGQAAANAAGDIVVTGLSKGLQAAGGALGQAALTQVAKTALNNAPTYNAPADPYSSVDPIVVNANRAVAGSGLPFGAAFSVPVNEMLSGALTAAQPTPAEQPVTQQPTDDEILVEARKSFVPPETLAALPVIGGLAAATGGGGAASNVVNGIDQATGEIVVEAPQSVAAPPLLAGFETALPAITQGALTPAQTSSTPPKDGLSAKDIADYLRLASLGVSTVGGLLSGDKAGGSSGKIPAGMGALSSLFSKQLPTSTLPSGGALPASTLAGQGFNSPQNYYRYGYGPEQSFFDYATQGAPNTSRAYTGYEGSTAEDAFAAQPMRVAMPQPITTPVPNNPAGPIMLERDPMRFAQGGYAVEGAGDGRDDKIPALLSDGEYVIDAETVALLGNGSNKAGAELLDSFRVNVRKQKGKKLARGEFSDNAKRPEHYMSGGYA